MSARAETLSRLHRLSVADYHRMGEAGVFVPGERTELIEGAIIDMPPIGSRHAGMVRRLDAVFSRFLRERAIVSVQCPVVLGDLSEPQPDVALLHPREDFYAAGHPGPEDVLLVVEVADTSVDFDRHTKLPLYARHAVPEAWLIDLPGQALEVHRHPEQGAYTRLERLGPGDLAAVRVPGVSGASIDLTGLL